MTETQLDFFRRLCAPFAERALFSKQAGNGGPKLTYLKAPTIMNRLDDVAGPDGWNVELIETQRGFICRLGILVPVGVGEGTRVWMYKDDAGGYEGMTKKAGGETVTDTDNDEKSAATNAFRRAAHVWGIGRYLWKCGVAEYLGDEPAVPDIAPPPADPAPARRRQAEPDAAPEEDDAAPPRRGRSDAAPPARRPPAGGRGNGGGGGYDNFALPRSGRALYAWASNLEKHYQTADKFLIRQLDAYAKNQGCPAKFAEFDQDQVDDVAWYAVELIREGVDGKKPWQAYNGEMDHVEMPESLGDPR